MLGQVESFFELPISTEFCPYPAEARSGVHTCSGRSRSGVHTSGRSRAWHKKLPSKRRAMRVMVVTILSAILVHVRILSVR
jgi:hypothetical protein